MSADHELGGPENTVHPKDKEQNGIDSADPLKHAVAVNKECANSEKPPDTQVPGDVHRDGEDSTKTPKQPSTSRLPSLEKMQDVANQVLLRYIQGQESEEYEDDELIACRYCGFTLTKAEKLERITLKKHTRALFCGICRWSSSETAKLQKHLSLKHPGERTTFYCQNCEFRSNSILEGQLSAMYSSDMPYQCGECEYRARTTTALNYHVKAKHSNERPYKCPHCNYAGVQSSSLKSHMLTRHNAGEKNILCTECDFRANIPSVMKKHMERKHSDVKARPGSKRVKRQDSLDDSQRTLPLEAPSLLHLLQPPPTVAPLVAEPPRVQAAPEVTDYLQMPSFGLFEAIYESQGLAVGKAPQLQQGRQQNSDVIIIED